jgi:hypothetical protein
LVSSHVAAKPFDIACIAQGTLPNKPQHVGFWPILLQKSFWGGERKFLEPLMRFARGDVRDHLASSKIDHGSPR